MLERLGFVRLRDFGLILTEDRRIVTTRKVLDDGFGATVVGWEGSDLVAIELAPAAQVVALAPPPPLPKRPPPPPNQPAPPSPVKQRAAVAFAPSDDPALNPNHPNHSMPVPSST